MSSSFSASFCLILVNDFKYRVHLGEIVRAGNWLWVAPLPQKDCSTEWKEHTEKRAHVVENPSALSINWCKNPTKAPFWHSNTRIQPKLHFERRTWARAQAENVSHSHSPQFQLKIKFYSSCCWLGCCWVCVCVCVRCRMRGKGICAVAWATIHHAEHSSSALTWTCNAFY